MATHDIITIGASAGGVETLTRLIARLPADLPAAVMIVLHLPRAPSSLDQILARSSGMPVAAGLEQRAAVIRKLLQAGLKLKD